MAEDTIQSCWESFKAASIQDDAHATQPPGMRLAFYAGANSMLMMCLSIVTNNLNYKESVDMIDKWRLEMERFRSTTIAGEA